MTRLEIFFSQNEAIAWFLQLGLLLLGLALLLFALRELAQWFFRIHELQQQNRQILTELKELRKQIQNLEGSTISPLPTSHASMSAPATDTANSEPSPSPNFSFKTGRAKPQRQLPL